MDARPFPVALSKPAIPTLPLTRTLSLLATAVKHSLVCFIQPDGRYLLLFSWVPVLEAMPLLTLPEINAFQLWLRLSSSFPEPPLEGFAPSKPVSELGLRPRAPAVRELGMLCAPGLSVHSAEETEKRSVLGSVAMLSVIPGSPSWSCSMLSVKYKVNLQATID